LLRSTGPARDGVLIKGGAHLERALRVSNDNPYWEALFTTLKYGPEFPDRFGSFNQARDFMDTFTHW
jgi:hypothetical protein